MVAQTPQVFDYPYYENVLKESKTANSSGYEYCLSPAMLTPKVKEHRLGDLTLSYNKELERINNYSQEYFNIVFSKLKSELSQLDYLKSGFDIVKDEQMSISLTFKDNLILFLTKQNKDTNYNLISMSIFKNKELIFAGLSKIDNFVSKFNQYNS